jgi:hypothetical protein
MKKYDQIGSLLWIILGILLSAGSIELNIGNFHRPGPGFMPFLSGLFLILSGLSLIFSATLKGSKEWEDKKDKKIHLKLKNIFLPLLILFGYILFLEPFGFIITAFLFLFTLFKLAEPKSWIKPFALSVCTVVLSYLIFSVWLDCRFPQGILRYFLMG